MENLTEQDKIILREPLRVGNYQETDILGREKVEWSIFFNGDGELKDGHKYVRSKHDEDRILLLAQRLESGEELFPPVVNEKDEILIGHHTIYAYHLYNSWPTCTIIRIKNKPLINEIKFASKSNMDGPLPLKLVDFEHICNILLDKYTRSQIVEHLAEMGLSSVSAQLSIQRAISHRNNRICLEIVSKIPYGQKLSEKFIEKICKKEKISSTVLKNYIKRKYPDWKMNQEAPQNINKCPAEVSLRKQSVRAKFTSFNHFIAKFWSETSTDWNTGKINLEHLVGIYRLYIKLINNQTFRYKDQQSRLIQKLGPQSWRLEKKRNKLIGKQDLPR